MQTTLMTWIVRPVGIAVILTAAASCGSSPASATPSPPSATATPSAAHSGDQGSQKLGTTVATAAGDSYTVIAFMRVQSKDQVHTPAPGGAFSAADIKECAGAGHSLTTDPTAWTVDFSGNNQAQGRDASLVAVTGAPLATSAAVSPGQCVEGWVAFTGFADGVANEIHLAGAPFWWSPG